MEKSWFELTEIRKRRLGDAVWIPLMVSERLRDEGKFGYIGYVDEYYGLGSVAIPIARSEDAKKLSWNDIGSHSQGIWATADYYKPADVFQYNDKEDLGVELALVQRFPTEDPPEWHLNLDVIFALGLKREGDFWLKPDEDYIEVARLRRHTDGHPVALEIKNDFLRDYLAARKMFLRTSMYRQRVVVVANVEDAGSPVERQESSDTERFEIHVSPMVEGGHFGDATYAVFHVGRTDVDADEDVPTPGPETATNTKSKSWHGKHEGRKLLHVSGELWREENILPVENSVRVRGDRVPSGLQFIIDAAGGKTAIEELNDEDIGRWLWFRPEVIPAISNRRSGSFKWYTMDTGGVGLSGGNLTHFGINRIGLINVYAYDVARLPVWQQQIWAGHNVVPEGGVSEELLASQMRAEPAHTAAPEQVLGDVITSLNQLFYNEVGAPLFRPHAETESIMARISRFRPLIPGGFFSLAKDLMRVVADQIDVAALQRIVGPPKGEKWGSLKSLENFLATRVGAATAHELVGPLFGAYDLRLADAHMPKSELDDAYRVARVDPDASPIAQGFRLIASVVSTLMEIDWLVSRGPEESLGGQTDGKS
jgi:hypothetical protein